MIRQYNVTRADFRRTRGTAALRMNGRSIRVSRKYHELSAVTGILPCRDGWSVKCPVMKGSVPYGIGS